MSTLVLLVVVALVVSALALSVAGVVAFRFRRTWRALRSLHVRFSALEQTRGDARSEINKCALRVAELEHRAGMKPPSVYHDMRKVRPVEFEEDQANDAAAASSELPRMPRLGDKVSINDERNIFAGEVSVVDHIGKKVSVKDRNGHVANFDWGQLHYAP